MSIQVDQVRATVEDLFRTPDKAELIRGRIVPLMPTGDVPNQVAGNIYVSLRSYARQTGRGAAYTDNMGYTVSGLSSGRESFSPDASFFAEARPKYSLRFIAGAPTFGAEVRSEHDYGDAAEEEMAAKRADYFQAGTLVVWDVDCRARCVHVYRQSDATTAVTYRPGQTAEAEPALPGWQMPVDEIFSVA